MTNRTWVSAAVPPRLQHADARTRPNHLPSSLTVPVPIATNEPMSWSNEYISVTARGFEAVDVRQRDRRRRIEDRAGGLDGDDEPRLLAEAGHHRHLVAVHDGDADAAGLRSAGERHLARAERQREAWRFGNRQRAAAGRRRHAELIRGVERQQVDRLADGVVWPATVTMSYSSDGYVPGSCRRRAVHHAASRTRPAPAGS